MKEATTTTTLDLTATDRARLREAMEELLSRGSILGLDQGMSGLYAWCRVNPDLLRDVADLSGLDVQLEHESRLVQAIPKNAALTMRLPKDATLVLLALWYEYDTQLRDGASQVFLSVMQLNQLLKEKLLPDVKALPSPTRMREILQLARRFNLIQFVREEPLERSQIEVLQTLKRVIPFNGMEEWTKTAQLHRTDAEDNEEPTPGVPVDPLP